MRAVRAVPRLVRLLALVNPVQDPGGPEADLVYRGIMSFAAGFDNLKYGPDGEVPIKRAAVETLFSLSFNYRQKNDINELWQRFQDVEILLCRQGEWFLNGELFPEVK